VDLQISLVNHHPREEAARDQLLRLHERYDLTRWQFTNRVAINHLEIPHSHPVLTLNAHWLRDDLAALSTYLHEQMHWFSLSSTGDFAIAGRELRERYPEVPDFEAGGARNERSTYLHFVICALEYQALADIVGETEAIATINVMTHYRWIYDTVLGQWPYFSDLLARTGIVVPG